MLARKLTLSHEQRSLDNIMPSVSYMGHTAVVVVYSSAAQKLAVSHLYTTCSSPGELTVV